MWCDQTYVSPHGCAEDGSTDQHTGTILWVEILGEVGSMPHLPHGLAYMTRRNSPHVNDWAVRMKRDDIQKLLKTINLYIKKNKKIKNREQNQSVTETNDKNKTNLNKHLFV